MNPPAIEIAENLWNLTPGRALDLACGSGRHALWLRDKGWNVTAVDARPFALDGVTCIQSDLESHEFVIEPGTWDLIVCWLYWQEDLMPAVAAGVHPGGHVALAGKTTGRFATSLETYRRSFADWRELRAGEDAYRVYFVAQLLSRAAADHTAASSG